MPKGNLRPIAAADYDDDCGRTDQELVSRLSGADEKRAPGTVDAQQMEKTAKGKPVIHEFFTLAVPQMMGSGPIITRVLKTAQHRLGVELDRQVAYIAGGGRT